jgi:Putative restriction endonuclease
VATLIRDSDVERRLIARRRILGIDKFDEVSDGVYIMNPSPNVEHQQLVMRISYLLESLIGVPGAGIVCPGVNVSDRQRGWKRNYRVPDIAVYLNETRAVNCGTHWFGGPDFAVEIATAGERSRDKLDFYSKVGTRELLVIDRKPWLLELYRHDGKSLVTCGKSTLKRHESLASTIVPLQWRIVTARPRPQIVAVHAVSHEEWRL